MIHYVTSVTPIKALCGTWVERESWSTGWSAVTCPRCLYARIAELEAERRWIPVGEGLPEKEMETLILVSGFAFSAVFRSRYDGAQYWTRSGQEYHIGSHGVTHWMLIPQAPEVKP